MPRTAKPSTPNVYAFDSPAWRGTRACLTPVVLKPTHEKSPRMKRLRSSIVLMTSTMRRSIEPEVRDVARDPAVRHAAGDQVEEVRVELADRAGALARREDAVDVVVALFPLGDELRDDLGRVLEVGRHQDRGVTGHVAQAGGEPAVHVEVARELDDLEARVALVQREQLVPRVVQRPVLDDDRLEVVVRHRVEHCSETRAELIDALRLVIRRNNDRDELLVHHRGPRIAAGYPAGLCPGG